MGPSPSPPMSQIYCHVPSFATSVPLVCLEPICSNHVHVCVCACVLRGRYPWVPASVSPLCNDWVSVSLTWPHQFSGLPGQWAPPGSASPVPGSQACAVVPGFCIWVLGTECRDSCVYSCVSITKRMSKWTDTSFNETELLVLNICSGMRKKRWEESEPHLSCPASVTGEDADNINTTEKGEAWFFKKLSEPFFFFQNL